MSPTMERSKCRPACASAMSAQEAPGGEGTPFATVLAAATERSRLLDEVEHATDPHRIGEIHERLNAIDARGAPARAARISPDSASTRRRSTGGSTRSP